MGEVVQADGKDRGNLLPRFAVAVYVGIGAVHNQTLASEVLEGDEDMRATLERNVVVAGCPFITKQLLQHLFILVLLLLVIAL